MFNSAQLPCENIRRQIDNINSMQTVSSRGNVSLQLEGQQDMDLQNINRNSYKLDEQFREGTKSRFSRSRVSIPTGNYDWVEFNNKKYRSSKNQDQPWSWKKKLLIFMIVAIVFGLLIFFLIEFSQTSKQDLHIESINPIIPHFQETRGKIAASKLQPLIDISSLTTSHESLIHHRLNYQ